MLHVFRDPEVVSRTAADFILGTGKRSIADHGRFRLVLCGGKTPERIFDILTEARAAAKDIWEFTDFFWGDERCVSPEHPDSNYRLAKEHLLDPLGISHERIHRMPADGPDHQRAAAEYEKGFPEKPDLVLLGMGADGHTASLFPGTPAVHEREKRVTIGEAPEEPRHRLTITPPAIESARNVLVIATGANKAAALARVFAETGDIDATPARIVRDALWFVDREAAAEIDNETTGRLAAAPTGEKK